MIKLLSCAFVLSPLLLFAQEGPYIVTYDHHLEEPGSLEIEYFSTFGTQRHGNPFVANWMEFEFGTTAWWTTEFYVDMQSTFHDSTIYTGFRIENRFRILKREHFINPVLYIEYENTSDADKIVKEVEGHDVESDFADPNWILREGHNHELELKMILSKDWRGWNFALNPLFVKNLSPSESWEFGYAWGLSHPLGLKAKPTDCNFCRENFIVGVEMYGGLGDIPSLGLNGTSHYIAPCMSWNLPSGWTVRVSPGLGLNGDSHRLLLRWGLSYEIPGFREMIQGLFGGRK
jgi:hypothetical protein